MAQRYIKHNRDPRYKAPTPPQWPGIWFMVAVIFFAMLVLSGCAYAQEQLPEQLPEVQLACGPIEQVLDALEHQFGETLLSQKEVDGLLFELWGNEDTGTWTLLGYPDGESVCIVDDGVLIKPGVAI